MLLEYESQISLDENPSLLPVIAEKERKKFCHDGLLPAAYKFLSRKQSVETILASSQGLSRRECEREASA